MIKVKPIKWHKSLREEFWVARTMVGVYSIFFRKGEGFEAKFRSTTLELCPTLEKAQEVGFQHYEASILSVCEEIVT